MKARNCAGCARKEGCAARGWMACSDYLPIEPAKAEGLLDCLDEEELKAYEAHPTEWLIAHNMD